MLYHKGRNRGRGVLRHMDTQLDTLTKLKATLLVLSSLLQEGVVDLDEYSLMRDSAIAGAQERLRYNK